MIKHVFSQFTGLVFSNRASRYIYLEAKDDTGKSFILRNEISPGRHALWWTNYNQIYAAVFEVKAGENLVKPRFKRYDLPVFQPQISFDSGSLVQTLHEEKEYTDLSITWEERPGKMILDGTFQAEIQDDLILIEGEVTVTHPGGTHAFPVSLTGNAVNSRAGIRTEWESLYKSDTFDLMYQLRQNRKTLFLHVMAYPERELEE